MLHIFVDSDCDITKAQAEEYGVSLISMPYFIGEKEVYPYVDFEEFEPHAYYNMLREGTIPTTAALSPANYKEIFEPAFAKGDTILYIHFSSAMSLTFDNMEKAISELKPLALTSSSRRCLRDIRKAPLSTSSSNGEKRKDSTSLVTSSPMTSSSSEEADVFQVSVRSWEE